MAGHRTLSGKARSFGRAGTEDVYMPPTDHVRASVTDDSYFPGGFAGLVYERLARFQIGEDETLDAQLATLGYSAGDVDTAILSHLHQDHIGGLRELKGADLLVSATEWDELSRFAPQPRGYLREHITVPGLTWQQIRFEPSGDRRSRRSPSRWTSWATARSSCSRHLGTRPVRCPCSSGDTP